MPQEVALEKAKREKKKKKKKEFLFLFIPSPNGKCRAFLFIKQERGPFLKYLSTPNQYGKRGLC